MKLKVYGGNDIHHGRQVRAIVAATSQKEAARLTGCNLRYVRDYWCVTGNDKELAIALARPGVVFCASSTNRDDFEPKES